MFVSDKNLSTGDTVQTHEYTVYGQVAASDPNHPNRGKSGDTIYISGHSTACAIDTNLMDV